MQSIAEYLAALKTARWNAIVTKHMTFVREEAKHYVFIHATKGKRYVSKRRLGVA